MTAAAPKREYLPLPRAKAGGRALERLAEPVPVGAAAGAGDAEDTLVVRDLCRGAARGRGWGCRER